MILGAVLAGGRARRFGSDKALAKWQGRALLDHAIDALRPHCDAVIVVGRVVEGLDCTPDLPEPGLGPLGGIAGALAAARARGARSVLTVPCDVPAPPETLLKALRTQPGYCADHPVFGRWPASLAEPLLAWLRAGRPRAVHAFAKAAGVPPIRSPEPIRDVDTREDLERL